MIRNVILAFALFTAPVALAETDLIGGTVQNRADWPASFTTTQTDGSRCTGTLIGERVLQLAAHCVSDGADTSITVQGRKRTATCTNHPDFATDSTADFSLCLFRDPVEVAFYETINTDPTRVKVGEKLTLCGFGCTQPGGGGGNNDVLRCGDARVLELPGDDFDIVLRDRAALCFGDSGGSAFVKDERDNLFVAGVNSRGNIRDLSLVPAVTEVLDFYQDFALDNNVAICGLTLFAPNCRPTK